MKLTIRTRNMPVSPAFDLFVESCIMSLAAQRRLDHALITVERRDEQSPPFRAVLDIGVPGPDVRCEQIDHSPVRAFTRALGTVEQKLKERSENKVRRLRHRQNRTAGSRFPATR